MKDPALDALRSDYLRLLQRLEANERDFRRLGRAVWRVQEDERRRLARDLHDGIGQNLTALKHRLVQLEDGLPADQQQRLHAAIALETFEARAGVRAEAARQLPRSRPRIRNTRIGATVVVARIHPTCIPDAPVDTDREEQRRTGRGEATHRLTCDAG